MCFRNNDFAYPCESVCLLDSKYSHYIYTTSKTQTQPKTQLPSFKIYHTYYTLIPHRTPSSHPTYLAQTCPLAAARFFWFCIVPSITSWTNIAITGASAPVPFKLCTWPISLVWAPATIARPSAAGDLICAASFWLLARMSTPRFWMDSTDCWVVLKPAVPAWSFRA